MAWGGAVLKVGGTVLRAVEFLAAIAILGIFGYFLAYLRTHELPTLQFVRAVTGIAGAAALYTLIAFFLTCCLGGKTVFAFIGIVLDVAFAAAFIAVAVLTKDGNTNCSSLNDGATIYADSDAVVDIDADTAQRICHMYRAAFVLAIIELILFFITALFQFGMGRAHQRDKRRGVEAKGPRFPFRRNRHAATQRDIEDGAVPVGNGYKH